MSLRSDQLRSDQISSVQLIYLVVACMLARLHFHIRPSDGLSDRRARDFCSICVFCVSWLGCWGGTLDEGFPDWEEREGGILPDWVGEGRGGFVDRGSIVLVGVGFYVSSLLRRDWGFGGLMLGGYNFGSLGGNVLDG